MSIGGLWSSKIVSCLVRQNIRYREIHMFKTVRMFVSSFSLTVKYLFWTAAVYGSVSGFRFFRRVIRPKINIKMQRTETWGKKETEEYKEWCWRLNPSGQVYASTLRKHFTDYLNRFTNVKKAFPKFLLAFHPPLNLIIQIFWFIIKSPSFMIS